MEACCLKVYEVEIVKIVEIVNNVYDLYFFYFQTLLPRANRLKKRKDFERVFKKGKGFKEDFLFFKWKFNNLGVSRFGFIVSKKVSKKAVLRKKIQRRIREIIRARIKKIKKGIDGIFIASPEIEKKGFKEIETAIDKIFKKTKLIADEN